MICGRSAVRFLSSSATCARYWLGVITSVFTSLSGTRTTRPLIDLSMSLPLCKNQQQPCVRLLLGFVDVEHAVGAAHHFIRLERADLVLRIAELCEDVIGVL